MCNWRGLRPAVDRRLTTILSPIISQEHIRSDEILVSEKKNITMTLGVILKKILCIYTMCSLSFVFFQVLWMLREKRILPDLEDLITDDLFELVFNWLKEVPESSLLKKSLDAS